MSKDIVEDEGVELYGTFVRETDAAELWELEAYAGQIWIPKSQIVSSDQTSEVVVTAWLGKRLEEEHG